MNIAICGASCSGKTTLAKLLAERLGCDRRGCGSLVRSAASRLGVAPEALPVEVHTQIDAETIQFAETPGAAHHKIIEGRFLRHVLARCNQPILMVELFATKESRLLRWQGRMGSLVDMDWLTSLDAADADFIKATYRDSEPLNAAITIDTSQQSVSECADTLAETLAHHLGAST